MVAWMNQAGKRSPANELYKLLIQMSLAVGPSLMNLVKTEREQLYMITNSIHGFSGQLIWIGAQLPYDFKFIKPGPSNLGKEYFRVWDPL